MKDKSEEKKSQIKGFKKLGYVRFLRGFKDDPLWKKKREFSQFEAWLDLYSEANGIDRDVEFRKRIIKLKRGQLVISIRTLAKRWAWSKCSVEFFLKKLEVRRTITIEILESPPCSIINFLNYNKLNPIKEKNGK